MMMLLFFVLWTNFRQDEGGNIIPILGEYKRNMTSRVGSTVQLICPISSNSEQPGFYISWTVNGIDENMLSVDLRYQFKDSNKILQVSNLRSDDSGLYVCKGVTGYGAKEATFNLIIIDENICQIPVNRSHTTRFKPCFLNPSMKTDLGYQRVVRDIGSSVEFDCSSIGSPAPKYLWMKGKSSADWIDNITGIRQSLLRIERIRLEYAGYYTCRVFNSVGEISFTYTLIVREKHSKIPTITKELGNISANVGGQAMIVASITCYCKPVLQWLKRTGNKSMSNKHVPIPNPSASERNELYAILDPENSDNTIETIEKNSDMFISVLKIKSVIPEDSGKYILFANNGDYGMSYGVAFLDVQEDSDSTKKTHPRLVLYIAIPIFILILCFGILFYCWSRRHVLQRLECPRRFCIGSSSESSSTNIKSLRSNNPGSTTTTSAYTGKCSTASSIFGRKSSVIPNDSCSLLSGNILPLLTTQNCNRSFSSTLNSNSICQEKATLDPNHNPGILPQFCASKDTSPYSYSKMPIQQTVFPHSISRISNSSQPNTQSGSSNCSGKTNRSNNYPHTQPVSQSNTHSPRFQMNNSMPPFIVVQGINQICSSDQCYPQNTVEVSNRFYNKDIFSAYNTSTSPHSFPPL